MGHWITLVSGVTATLVTLLGAAKVATARPGDQRLLTGTVVLPPRPGGGLAVIRGADGRTYFADLAGVVEVPSVPTGGAITIVGREGLQQDVIRVNEIVERDAAVAGGPATRAGAAKGR